MPMSLQLVLSNPTPGNEDEFNRWYGSEHMEHALRTPGVLAGQRFHRAAGPWPSGKHDYLMIWELDDPAFALAELAKVKFSDSMPISAAIDMDTIQPPTMWRRAIVFSAARVATDTAQRKTIVFALANATEGHDQVFERTLLGGYLAALADLPGVLSAEFLTLADEQIRGNARKFRFGLVIELIDEDRALRGLAKPLAETPYLDPQRWLAPVFRPIGGRVTAAKARAVATE
jgi:hypothetical protein